MKRKEEISTLYINVDMINGFIKKGNMADKDINHIIEPNLKLIRQLKDINEGIAFVREAHNLDSIEFRKFPIHCLDKTDECELVNELKIYEDDGITYRKNSTSFIFAPHFLEDIEGMKKLKLVIVGGCCTDICILNGVIPLVNYFDQHNRNVRVIVPQNLVETYYSDLHNRGEYNAMAFKLMTQAGVETPKEFVLKKEVK